MKDNGTYVSEPYEECTDGLGADLGLLMTKVAMKGYGTYVIERYE